MGPYKEIEQPTVRQSFCLFIDALGFKNEILINDSKDGEKANEHLRKFHLAFTDAISFLDDEDGKMWETKIFTDNIVLGSPLDKWYGGQEEGVFGSIITGVMWYQLLMIQKGFFFRGGWSIGNLYMDDKIVYGQALIEAYIMESQLAKYPRIILSQQMKELVNRHMKFYYSKNWCPQVKCILRDEQDCYFVNYLFASLEYATDFSDVANILKNHKDGIEKNLRCHNDENILEKYRWVAYYHNYFCKNFIENCSEEFFIEVVKKDQWKIEELPWHNS